MPLKQYAIILLKIEKGWIYETSYTTGIPETTHRRLILYLTRLNKRNKKTNHVWGRQGQRQCRAKQHQDQLGGRRAPTQTAAGIRRPWPPFPKVQAPEAPPQPRPRPSRSQTLAEFWQWSCWKERGKRRKLWGWWSGRVFLLRGFCGGRWWILSDGGSPLGGGVGSCVQWERERERECGWAFGVKVSRSLPRAFAIEAFGLIWFLIQCSVYFRGPHD